MSVRFWDAMAMSQRLNEAFAQPASIALAAVRARTAARPQPFVDRQIMAERFGSDVAETHLAAWRDLLARAIEPNVFMDPAFAAPAAAHMPPALRPHFVAIWEGVGFEPRGRMIALMAVEPRASLLTRGLAHGWLHRHSALGAPLVDRAASARAIDALYDWAAQQDSGVGLVLPRMVRSGPLFSALVARAIARNRPWSATGAYERAVLRHDRSAAAITSDAHSGKRRKDLNRKVARLSDIGAVEFGSACAPDAIRAAVEEFLALEQTGWKGRRGTALLSDIGDATFTRTMTRLMARGAQCRVDWLALDGRPIAMAIMIKSGGRGYFWKTAYDEAYSAYSPGVLLARALIESQLADPSIDFTDSCAIANHPMIDHIWPDRQTMADLEICCDPSRAAHFQSAARRRSAWRNLRARAKTVVAGALGRRIS